MLNILNIHHFVKFHSTPIPTALIYVCIYNSAKLRKQKNTIKASFKRVDTRKTPLPQLQAACKEPKQKCLIKLCQFDIHTTSNGLPDTPNFSILLSKNLLVKNGKSYTYIP